MPHCYSKQVGRLISAFSIDWHEHRLLHLYISLEDRQVTCDDPLGYSRSYARSQLFPAGFAQGNGIAPGVSSAHL